MQSIDSIQNARDVNQILNLFENIGASFDEQGTLMRVLQRNLLSARTALRQAHRQATQAILGATNLPRTSQFAAIQTAFAGLTQEQQTAALQFQIALRIGNLDELRTRLQNAIARTPTTFTTFRPRPALRRPNFPNRPGLPNRPAFPGNRPNLPGGLRPNRPTNNNNGNANPNNNPNNNPNRPNRPNRPNNPGNPNRPNFPGNGGKGKGKGKGNGNGGNNNPIIVVVPQNVAQLPQNGAAQQQPQNVAQQQPQNGVAAQQNRPLVQNDPFANMAVADEDVELLEQEEEFVSDAAVADLSEEELFEAEEEFTDAAMADFNDDEFSSDAAIADFEDDEFVDNDVEDAAFADFEDEEFVADAAMADENVGDDEFAAMALAGDASTAPNTSSAASLPSWGIALIVVGVLVLLGVVLVFVQLIRLLRA
jgi:hypothetical protein